MRSKSIGFFLLYLTGIAILAFGCIYIYTGFTKGLMPYHIKFLHADCSQLSHEVCRLMRTFVKIIGFAFLSNGLVFILIVHALRQGMLQRPGFSILLISMLVLTPIILIMKDLAPYTPWPIVCLILILGLSGWYLARKGS